MMNSILPQLINTLPFIAYAFAAVYFIIIVLLAEAVFRDAHRRTLTNKGTFLVGPAIWAIIILITGGFSGALAYWLIHYSSLRYVPKERTEPVGGNS